MKYIFKLFKIIIIGMSFICAFCIYESISVEKNIESTSKKDDNILIEDNKKNCDVVNEVKESVVGISKLKNKGNTIFLYGVEEKIGLGTGFIVSENGYIVTNAHVSGYENEKCYITFEDGREKEAEVVWANREIDLAILKIELNNLKCVKLGDSDNINIVENVYAIGNPIGASFTNTVTSGIISGIDRTVKIENNGSINYIENLIQTDAAINYGNSGGPLINDKGEVIGINTVKIKETEGLNFAIPINIVKPIISLLEKNGYFEEASIGLFAFDKNMMPYVDSNLVDLKINSGIYVVDVEEGSAAQDNNILEGDIIVQVEGKDVNRMIELRNIIFSKKPGESINLKILRNKNIIEKNVVLSKKNKKHNSLIYIN